ncbi:hypothetical protein SAMN05192558_107289 [Actinokineospora alba]|uniref:Uncharacterized protein n=1 Tax=Actinokineospora alba TaxID=504798 RepID=A0A1H0R5B4_9PSEU|nr:hypothetical protein SAMN05421871_104288 [Actinokineospora alba]SDP24246.1 hypothetical protein SAMN05192558_107289 [Actinokineospora alba]
MKAFRPYSPVPLNGRTGTAGWRAAPNGSPGDQRRPCSTAGTSPLHKVRQERHRLRPPDPAGLVPKGRTACQTRRPRRVSSPAGQAGRLTRRRGVRRASECRPAHARADPATEAGGSATSASQPARSGPQRTRGRPRGGNRARPRRCLARRPADQPTRLTGPLTRPTRPLVRPAGPLTRPARRPSRPTHHSLPQQGDSLARRNHSLAPCRATLSPNAPLACPAGRLACPAGRLACPAGRLAGVCLGAGRVARGWLRGGAFVWAGGGAAPRVAVAVGLVSYGEVFSSAPFISGQGDGGPHATR